ncbi:MAG: STAS domain-containing protein [Actinomycetota bacterium]
MTAFEVTVTGLTTKPIVTVVGEIDLTATQALTDAAHQAARDGQVILDVSAMTFIDSTGLRVLVALAREGTTPVLRGANNHLRELLKTTSLDQLVVLADDEPTGDA